MTDTYDKQNEQRCTLQSLVVFVALVPIFIGAAFYNLPAIDHAFGLPVLAPAAMAAMAIWEAAACYRGVLGLSIKTSRNGKSDGNNILPFPPLSS